MSDRCDFRDLLGNRCTGTAGHGDTGREPHTFDIIRRDEARERVIAAARVATLAIPSRYPEIVALYETLVDLDVVENRA